MTQSNRPSFERVDYSIRPAKNIERKLIVELLRTQEIYGRIRDCVYVGMGSTFFSDFVLFHRNFDIKDMVSVENQVSRRDRFEYNKPYSAIRLEFGDTGSVLPRLDFSRRTIVWLDYDGKINRDKLDDIIYLSQNVVSRSIVLYTINAVPDTREGNPPDLNKRLDLIRQATGGKIPEGIMRPSDIAELHHGLWMITMAAISDALSARNAALPANQHIQYYQFINLRYRDTAWMATFGGAFLNSDDAGRLDESQVSELEFFRPDDVPYVLDPPKLTLKERRHIDEELPNGNPTSPGVSAGDITEYAKIYRYFPWFVEAEI